MTESFLPEQIYWKSLNDWCLDWMKNFITLCKNCDITLEAEEGFSVDYNVINMLCISSNITFEVVKSYPNIRWNFSILSSNPNITTPVINNNPECDWDYNYMSSNKNITVKFVTENNNKKWNHNELKKILPKSFFHNKVDLSDRNMRKTIKIAYIPNTDYMVPNPVFRSERDVRQYLSSSFISWDDIFRISKECPFGMQINRKNLIDIIIYNEMKVSRNNYISNAFRNAFKTSALKNDILSSVRKFNI